MYPHQEKTPYHGARTTMTAMITIRPARKIVISSRRSRQAGCSVKKNSIHPAATLASAMFSGHEIAPAAALPHRLLLPTEQSSRAQRKDQAIDGQSQ
jgi:hypothetical protein